MSAKAAFREDVTLNVPFECPTINDALYDLDEKNISRFITVTIKVADGIYNLDSRIVVDHPNSSRIRIIGNETTPANCTLNFTEGTGGFIFYTGIKELNGFRLQNSLGQGDGVYALAFI